MTDGELLSLHRYYVWANRMREHFDHELRRGGEAGLDSVSRDGAIDIEVAMYKSLWYGVLYVVIEGWQDLDLSDPEIDELLASPNTAKLKRYRNATFHFQRHYWDERFLQFLREGEDTAAWARQLNRALGKYFLSTIQEGLKPVQ